MFVLDQGIYIGCFTCNGIKMKLWYKIFRKVHSGHLQFQVTNY